MQNARLSELEKILAKSSASGGGFGRKTLSAADLRSSEEYNNLKEENRVVRTVISFLSICTDQTNLSMFVLVPFLD